MQGMVSNDAQQRAFNEQQKSIQQSVQEENEDYGEQEDEDLFEEFIENISPKNP